MASANDTIPRERLDAEALLVVRRLQQQHHQAYLVGGCVRDLLLGRTPKDFDVATSATPDQIRRIFRNCRIIGRRFRLAHIYFNSKIIETSTFRCTPILDETEEGEDRIIWQDNAFGTSEEDAHRRDLTINGLFYDPVAEQVIDYVEGLPDLRAGIVRTIGDPRLRVQEDPVRILRAVKFAARLGMRIDPATSRAMVEFRGLIAYCSVARVLEEIYRILGSGSALPAFRLLHDLGVLGILLPEVEALLPPSAGSDAYEGLLAIQQGLRRRRTGQARPPMPDAGGYSSNRQNPEEVRKLQNSRVRDLLHTLFSDEDAARAAGEVLWRFLAELDQQVPAPPPCSHAFLLAAILCPMLEPLLGSERTTAETQASIEALVVALSSRLAISRRDRQTLMLLLLAQPRLTQAGRRVRTRSLLERDYFEDALRLLTVRHGVSGEHAQALGRWTQLRQSLPPTEREDRARGRRGRHRGRGRRTPMADAREQDPR